MLSIASSTLRNGFSHCRLPLSNSIRRSIPPSLRLFHSNTPLNNTGASSTPDPSILAKATTQLQHLGTYISSCLPKHIQQTTIYKDELTLHVPPTSLIPTMTFLRDHAATQFEQVQDITAVDYPSRSNRFEIVYNLLSVRNNLRIRVKTYASETSTVPSITSLYAGTNWFEREVYDMYGIMFTSHPDLRRILTDYGFEGYPMRKDFPLTGYVEVRYCDEKKKVVVEPVEMAQAFRMFEYQSPWEMVGDGVPVQKVIGGDSTKESPKESLKESLKVDQKDSKVDPKKPSTPPSSAAPKQ